MRKVVFIAGTSLAAIITASPAFAQEVEPSAGAAAVNDNVIIVTGLKRDQDLQDVNVAATVIGGENLTDLGVERFDDLQTVVPSLSVSDSGLTQSVNIRGVGLASGSPSAANGVATYIDGVFQPPIVSTNSFYDIGSVEVLRGPQGTFVGSNSTGGAIFINSRAPELGDFNGYVQGEFGNYSRGSLEGAINLPVGNTLAVRVAGIARTRDSYYNNINGRDPAQLQEYGARVGVYWEPSSSFNALIRGEVADKETGGYAYRPIVGTAFEAGRTNDIRLLDYNSPTQNDETNQQVTARLEYYTDSDITFRVIGGYQDKQIQNLYDSDGTSLAMNEQTQFVREEVYTGEVNIISDDTQRFSWIVGGYFQRNEILVDITNNPNGFPVDVDIENRKITTGLFGQVSYDISDTLSVDLGGRYSTYDVEGSGAVTLRLPGIVVGDPGGSYDDDQFTGKLGLNFEPNADHLFYAFVAKGYKSGGFASPTTSFEPEQVWDYEIGWKGTFGPVTTQLGAFYYDYSDFQLDVIAQDTGRASLTNLTDATVKGIEGQVQVRSGALDLSAGFAYTDSSLSGTDFVDTRSFAIAFPGVSNAPQCPAGTPSNPPFCIDYSPFILTTDGGPNLYSPEFTFNASAAYTMFVGDLEITPRVSYSHLGDRFAYIAYDPVRDLLPAFDLVNASLTFEYEAVAVDFFGTNLLDEEYITGQSGNNEYYGAPTEYGVRARFTF
ncbi:TonB-dependent receptor [Aurantiacibacter rhizosphaerae]|uniref:TonB-dependent receptor n=1 Tax=Aurantiacibacter rhizosphaerae TaxID=2691582 RepID=A0A844XGA0_9SPHN|nr:TonB-dependent receptor [Aurantiacibacter rhizosphaerae]MWV28682.1 TonB-dependent receptor [Aurantiacibacter rhizosphaerae]